MADEANSRGPRLDFGAQDAGIYICLLGSFRVLKAGRAVPIRVASRSEALLYELALRPRHTAPRESLLLALWPDVDAQRARQSLSSLLYSLHRLLGDGLHGAAPVVHSNGLYQLNVDAGISIDVADFETLVSEAGRRADAGEQRSVINLYLQAIRLYRGDLCAAGDTRAVVEREWLRAAYLTALARVAQHFYDTRDYSAALQYARIILHHDPCREDAHRTVMRCHARRGERAQALRQYRLCERVLRIEFDAPLEAATSELYEQVRLSPTRI